MNRCLDYLYYSSPGEVQFRRGYINPLVQQPPMADTSFHLHMEGRANNPDALEYGMDALFWRTSMGQAISSFRFNRTSPEQTSPGEEDIDKSKHLFTVHKIFKRECKG